MAVGVDAGARVAGHEHGGVVLDDDGRAVEFLVGQQSGPSEQADIRPAAVDPALHHAIRHGYSLALLDQGQVWRRLTAGHN